MFNSSLGILLPERGGDISSSWAFRFSDSKVNSMYSCLLLLSSFSILFPLVTSFSFSTHCLANSAWLSCISQISLCVRSSLFFLTLSCFSVFLQGESFRHCSSAVHFYTNIDNRVDGMGSLTFNTLVFFFGTKLYIPIFLFPSLDPADTYGRRSGRWRFKLAQCVITK